MNITKPADARTQAVSPALITPMFVMRPPQVGAAVQPRLRPVSAGGKHVTNLAPC
jgi:hypothetical protein